MPFPARRLGSALFTAGLAFATLTSVPTAGAAPHHRGADPADWFTDPLTTAQRAALVRVPTHPDRYDGKPLRWTRALYRSYDGSLAVPVTQSVGHDLVKGQAVTFPVPLSFPSRPLTGADATLLASLRTSTSSATRVRCEGYVRYGGEDPRADPEASRLRAAAFCAALSAGRSDLQTRSLGYGSSRPVVFGGPVSQQHTVRAANRRVVIIVTRTAPPLSLVPGTVNLAGLTVGDREAKVSFTKPPSGTSPITGYEYTLDDGASWNDLDTGDPEDNPVTGTIPDLTNGTAYTVRVRAVSDAGSGQASGPVTGTPVAAVVAPGRVVVTRLFGDQSVSLGFSAPAQGTSPITTYQWTKDGGDHWTDLTTTGSGPYAALISGLTNGESYTIQVRAVSADGEGIPSAAFTGMPSAPVVKPAQVVLDGSSHLGDGSATLVFPAPAAGSASILRYEYRTNGGSWTQLTVTGPTGGLLTGTVAGLTNGTGYEISVRAVSAAGNGDASVPVIGTPVSATVVPGAPTLTGIQFSDHQAVLTFTAPTDTGSDPISEYQYYIDGQGWREFVADPTGTEPLTATVTGLTNGTSYLFKVRANSAAGKGPGSNAISGTPMAPSSVVAPAQITGLTGAPGDTTAVLSFAKPQAGSSPILRYEWTTFEGSSWTPLATTGTDPLSGTVTGLTNGHTYHLVVRAVSADDAGEASNPVDVTPAAAEDPAVEPGPPTVVAEDSMLTQNGAVLWVEAPDDDGGSAITGYEVSVDGAPWVTAAWDGANVVSVTTTLNGPCDIRTFRVRAVNAVGHGTDSDAVEVGPYDGGGIPGGFARRC